MKTLIIYKSVHHGNTEQIARAMAEALGAKLAGPDDVSPLTLREYDLIGFGSGIYFGRHHRAIRALVDRLPTICNEVLVFSTSGDGRDHNGPLIARMERKGFKVKGSFACPGWDTFGVYKLIGGLQKGHPDLTDLENARAFARSMLK